jgi:hypothetical protein
MSTRNTGSEGDSRKIRCFLIAFDQSEGRDILDVLKERSIHCSRSWLQPRPSQDSFRSFRDAIQRSDFVIASFLKSDNEELYLYLGIAIGLDKPVIIVLPEGAGRELSALTNIVSLRRGKLFQDSLRFTIEQFEAGLRLPTFPSGVDLDSKRRDRKTATGSVERSAAKSSTLQIKRAKFWRADTQRTIEALSRDVASEADVTRALSEVIASQPNVIIAEGADAHRYDLGIWDERLNKSVGNPLYLQVKRSLPSASTARHAMYRQLSPMTDTSGAVIILLLKGPVYNDAEYPVMVELALDFMSTLNQVSFVTAVRQLWTRSAGNKFRLKS